MKNLLTRTLSGIVFLAIMVACILGGPISFACLMSLILVVMLWEFYNMTLPPTAILQKTIGIAAGLFFWLTLFFVMNNTAEYIAIPLFLLVCALWFLLFIQQLYQKDEKPFTTIAHTFLGFIYIALPWSLLNIIACYESSYDGWLLLALFIILWCSDVGAYCFGMLLGQSGKHKLFPSISPKKSWEGYFGGLVMAMVAGYVLSLVGFISLGLADVLAISAIIHVFGVFGDLIESMLKRSVGVKDSGKIMPGHGGLLDRFDAALLAFPAVCIYLLIMNVW